MIFWLIAFPRISDKYKSYKHAVADMNNGYMEYCSPADFKMQVADSRETAAHCCCQNTSQQPAGTFYPSVL